MNEIGNYRIIKKLGEGGMGEVLMGEDIMLERKVAIKILRPELSQREDILQRFRSEAVALGRLNHPNIATVYAFARDKDCYYMAMEFVNGETIDALITRQGQLAWQDAVRYVCDALAGLEHAHRLNVIHRDVKPANIMLNYTGEIKLMDFGIARILERARQTRSGHLIGTLEYISPEQAQGLEVDARSDIYSMGIVLYEMLTGHLPFQKKTDYELLQAQIKELPQSPRKFAINIPAALETIVLKALAKKPNERFTTALEFAQSLKSVLEENSFNKANSPQTRLANTSSNNAMPLEKTSVFETYKQENFRIFEFSKNYPIPVVAAILILLSASYFVLNPFTNKIEKKPQEIIEQKQVPIQPTENKIIDNIPASENKARPVLLSPPSVITPVDQSKYTVIPQLQSVQTNEITNNKLIENKQNEVNEEQQKVKQEAQNRAEKKRKQQELATEKRRKANEETRHLAQLEKKKKTPSEPLPSHNDDWLKDIRPIQVR